MKDKKKRQAVITISELPFFPDESLSASSSSNSLQTMEAGTLHSIATSNPSSPIQYGELPMHNPSAPSASQLPPVAAPPAAVTAPSPIQEPAATPVLAASSAPTQKKSDQDLLKETVFNMSNYIYVHKGLTDKNQKSYLSTFGAVLGNATGLAPQEDGRFDMFDYKAKINLPLFLKYIEVLRQAAADDSGSRKDLLLAIQDLYSSTLTASKLLGTRFPTFMAELGKIYSKALEDKDPAPKDFVNYAQSLHTLITPIPALNATEQKISEFIVEGHDSAVFRAVQAEIEKFPVPVPDEKKNVSPNRLDAKLNYWMVRLNEHIKTPEEIALESKARSEAKIKAPEPIHLHEIMHYLHKSLQMQQEIYSLIGVPLANDAFVARIVAAQQHLEHYRDPKHAEKLIPVLNDTVQLTLELTAKINKFKDGEHPFDPHMAKNYLKTVGKFASLPATEQRLRGAIDTILSGTNSNNNSNANTGSGSRSEKKTKVPQ